MTTVWNMKPMRLQCKIKCVWGGAGGTLEHKTQKHIHTKHHFKASFVNAPLFHPSLMFLISTVKRSSSPNWFSLNWSKIWRFQNSFKTTKTPAGPLTWKNSQLHGGQGLLTSLSVGASIYQQTWWMSFTIYQQLL